MDREGFVENEAFLELQELVRAGLEMLAYADHREQRRLDEAHRKEEAKSLRGDLKEAALFVRSVPGLSDEDREVVAEQFTRLSKELDDVEDFDWKRIDAAQRLHTVKIPYSIQPVSASRATGTTLIISKLRNQETAILTKEAKTELLELVDPYVGLDITPSNTCSVNR